MKAPTIASRGRVTPIPVPLLTHTNAPLQGDSEIPSDTLRFSTRSVPASRRLEYWNDLTAQTFGPMVIDAPDREAFDAEIIGLPFGEGELVSTWSGPSTLLCKGCGTSNVGAADSVNLGVLASGLTVRRQGGRVWQMRPGDWCLIDPSRPFVLNVESPSHWLTLRVPKTKTLEHFGEIDHIVGIRMSGSTGPGAALSSLIRGLWPAAAHPSREGWAEGLIEVVLSLAELVYKTPGALTETEGSVVDVRRGQAKAFIERNLRDPDLSARSIASSLGVSARYVQLLFAPLGVTPSAYILSRRLHLAAQQIRREHRARVGDVAYEVGFTDLSYFCRAFRRHFGQTPREYRQHLGG